MRVSLLILAICTFSSYAQLNEEKVDSLNNILPDQKGLERAGTLVELSFYFRREDPAQSIEYVKEVFEIADQYGDDSLKIDCYMNLGALYDNLDSAQLALSFYDKAISAAEKNGLPHAAFRARTNKGIYYIRTNRLDKASEYLFKALEIAESLNHKEFIGDTYNNIGWLFYYQEDFRKFLKYNLKALEYAREVKDQYSIGNSFVNIGTGYHQLEILDSAEHFFLKAIDHNIKNNDRYSQSYAYNNIGLVYRDQENHEKALEMLSKGLEIRTDYNDPSGIAFGNTYIGATYKDLKDYTKAIGYLQKGIEVAESHEYLELWKRGLQDLAEVYKELGKYKKAYDLKDQAMVVSDSIWNKDKTEAVLELEKKYETAKKEQKMLETKALAAKEKQKRLKVSNDNLKLAESNAEKGKWIFGLVGLLAISVGVFLVVFQIRKRKAEREKNRLILEERDRGMKAVLDAQEEERKRIAKDLHDGIGQQLSGLKMAWQSLSTKIGKRNPEQFNELIEITATLDESAEEVRNISHQMMPKALSEMGLVPAIQDMLEKSLTHTPITYEFEHYRVEQRFDETLEISLYRITQELINNVIKHSDAKHVGVQVFKNKANLILIVEDNGRGMDSTNSDGHGMMNIKSRLNTIHGEVNYDPSPGSGTVATVRVPIANQ